MKNNKNIVLLLLIVIFLWGYIAFKIYNRLDVEQPVTSKKIKLGNNSSNINIKEFSLHVDYQDPFLKNFATNNQKAVLKKTDINKPNLPKENNILEKVIPTILYKGMYKVGSNKKVFAIISVNNLDNHYSVGDTIQSNIVVAKITHDSIEIRNKNNFKYIKKINN
jgi:Tfp pilus assembly protein PilP